MKKKVLLIAMVIGMAIPAMAANISLVDNEDLTGTIQLTSAAGEDVRGLAIVVSVDGGATITAIGGVSAELNVNMDAASENPSYAIGDDVDVAADPAGAGTITLPASLIVICLGKVDQLGGQAAIPSGTIDVATITVSAGCTVTITEDGVRGGIVGDAVAAGTVAGGPITGGTTPECKGDSNDSGAVDLADLSAMVVLLGKNAKDIWTGSCVYSGVCDYYLNLGDPGFNTALDFDDNDAIDLADLSAMVVLLGQNAVDIWTGSCVYSGVCDYVYTCP